MEIRPSGPTDALVMIVGEAPGEQEIASGQPFMGASGNELNRMLHEAGIARSTSFVTNVVRQRPPGNDITAFIPQAKKDITADCILVRGKHCKPCVADGVELLKKELELVRPKVVLALGNTSLWALTGHWGIGSWRGSYLRENLSSGLAIPVIPSYHPAAVLREWAMRPFVVHDIKKAREIVEKGMPEAPEYRFITRPRFDQASLTLQDLWSKAHQRPLKLSVDLETRAGHIACIGLAWSPVDAISIPLMCVERKEGYWEEAEEAFLMHQMWKLLLHPNVEVIGQNFIYDAQYFWRHLHYRPRFVRDTMLAAHSMFSAMPKGLAVLSSLYYPYHVYWKDESKDWDPAVGEDQLWIYNCKDAVITWVIDEELQKLVDSLGLREHHNFQQEMFWPVLEAMSRGLCVDNPRRKLFAEELSTELKRREEWLTKVLGHSLNPRSPLQMKRLFYEDLNQRPIINRATKTITLNDKALETLKTREPLLRPLIKTIQEHRSLGVFSSTFVNASPAWDGRMRCSFNIGGTETYRLSSSQDAFGSGMNLQNIPSGSDPDDPTELRLPNVRKLFVPDKGYTFFDLDLDRADLQVVVWEAEDEELKAALRAGVDLHLLNAGGLFALGEITRESLQDPEFVKWAKKVYARQRQLAKTWVHGTNYLGQPRTMAATVGITIREAERLQKIWFHLHPGIARWHHRVVDSLSTKHYVENRFGARRYYFERLDGVLSEAVAWGPQSTVAGVINRAWLRIYKEAPQIQVLLQVHDSLGGQFPSELEKESVDLLRQLSQVVIPYNDPLTIPVGISISRLSWGDCKS